MAKWTAFPYADPAYTHTEATLKKHWARLHKGDCEPLPKDRKVLEAWLAYHRGDFQQAVELGLEAGPAGHNAANKATNIYAYYLEKSDQRKLDLYREVIARSEALQAAEPRNANAFYLCANAMGRYSQGISVVKALSQGLGHRIKDNLAAALKLQPRHAEAHVALGAFHAEVIDKVGAMIGAVTYGAKRDAALSEFRTALELMPESAIARTVYADSLVMLDGKKALGQAEKLYAEAAACQPADAMERLDVEAAKAEID
jgi:tetratricopeptide (TPR) repeat protein